MIGFGKDLAPQLGIAAVADEVEVVAVTDQSNAKSQTVVIQVQMMENRRRAN